jgi:hypothetical protein
LNTEHITDQNTRQTMVSLVYSEWTFFDIRARNLIQTFQSPILNQESVGSLKSSMDQLKKIVEALRIDQQYIENENTDRFSELMTSLEHTLKTFFKAYLAYENQVRRTKDSHRKGSSGETHYDSIEKLLLLMYDSIQQRKKSGGVQIQFGYPAIIKLIHFIRTLQFQEPRDIPRDYRTGMKSFGNLFTFSCMLILSFYAYNEMLEIWMDTI